MIDVSPKLNTLRYAKAEGFLRGKPDVLNRVLVNTVPKGDVLQVARASGILAAKRCSDWIVFCHPLPIDWIDLSITVNGDKLHVLAEVKSVWKTGVEMEALTAVTAALLNAYDMLKPLDDQLVIGEMRVVEKCGGKSDFAKAPIQQVTTAILVISDSTFAGAREDTSGRAIREFLDNQPVLSAVYEVLPDDAEQIERRLIELIDTEKISLIFTCGGTGLGPKDVTVEATRKVVEKEVPGISEAIRNHGKTRTPYAMLSRGVAGVRRESLVINLPGSEKGAMESLEALFPGLLHIFSMMRGEGHD